jgi:hypothetical protein
MATVIDRAKIEISILISALAADIFSSQEADVLVASLKKYSDVNVIEIARSFGSPTLTRKFNLAEVPSTCKDIELDLSSNLVSYKERIIGKTQILYKAPLPGELQARLAIESAIDRFLEYLQKVHQIVVLNESDRHIQIFIPNKPTQDLETLWKEFLENVAFSVYGKIKHQLPGLAQTFISMLNSVTLSERGFSTLDIPILSNDQSKVLAAWYFAVWEAVKKRQDDRQIQIRRLHQELKQSDLSEKDRKSKTKELQDKEAMQAKEAQKYTECFQKSFGKSGDKGKPLHEQFIIYQELKQVQAKLAKPGIAKAELTKLRKEQEKLSKQLVFKQEFVQQKLELLKQAKNPFKFVELDYQQNPETFKDIAAIAKNFSKTATDQINSARGDIFTQCITEMYHLLEKQQPDPLPPTLLTEHPIVSEVRSPGDESKEFCYSCGIALDPKKAKWKVARFMFERPSQRRQSSAGEDRPYICVSCAALAFASPLKVTEESIVLHLKSSNDRDASEIKLKDYLRMLTNKQMHLSAGRYIVLTSDRTKGGDLASQKLGQVQYAYAKVASIFPVEVLPDFRFELISQSSKPIQLESRHLIFIKGLMESYGQPIVIADKDINMSLGDAIRYVQQDLPYAADYTVTKISGISNHLELEKVREYYWRLIRHFMDTNTQLSKRAKLYRDVAALTGITYAFAKSLENKARAMDKDDREREVSKLIEQVDDATAFCYYATLGVETIVQARLWREPDNYFIYEQAKDLLSILGHSDREATDEAGKTWLQFYADDISRAYAHFAENGYTNEKEWKELTYQLKLSLYTRFPELVRKLKTTSEKN